MRLIRMRAALATARKGGTTSMPATPKSQTVTHPRINLAKLGWCIKPAFHHRFLEESWCVGTGGVLSASHTIRDRGESYLYVLAAYPYTA